MAIQKGLEDVTMIKCYIRQLYDADGGRSRRQQTFIVSLWLGRQMSQPSHQPDGATKRAPLKSRSSGFG